MEILLAALLFLSATAFAASSLYDFTMPALNGMPTPLAGFKGKVVLVVNVASQVRIHAPIQGAAGALREVQGPGLCDRRLSGE
jgi:hypothetical protein